MSRHKTAVSFNRLLDLAETHDVVSFDVFDTLFHRVCHPEVIIEKTCEEIGRKINRPAVLSLRHDITAELRKKRVLEDQENDPEYRFSDLRQALAKALSDFDQAETIVDSAFRNEIELEKQALFPNRQMVATAASLKAAGKTVVAISDMYLPKGVILELLTEAGAGDVFDLGHIFVSGDLGKTKSSGKLFQHVMAALGITPDKMLHIGDNPVADNSVPRSLGIATADYDADHHHNRYNRFPTLGAFRRSIASAAHEAGLAVLDEHSLHGRIASAISPVLCFFTKFLVEKTTTQNHDSVWFMARDGYLLKRLYDLAWKDGLPPSGYLYVSRKAVSPGSSQSYGIREAFLAEWNGENRKLRTFLNPVGLTENDQTNLAIANGFTGLDEDLDGPADPRLVRLLSHPDVSRKAKETGDKARNDLLKYLRKCGFLSCKHPAVVDVGWAGQIQEALQMALKLGGEERDIDGYYLAVRRLGGLRRLAGTKMQGLVFDCAKPDWRAQSLLIAVEAFEDSCRAPHGTVVGYANGEPILADGQSNSFRMEQADNPRLSALQECIVDYAKAWLGAVQIAGARAADTEAFALDASAMLARFPSREQADFFTRIGHSLDYGNEIILNKQQGAFSWSPIKMLRAVRAARWQEAAAATIPIAGRIIQLARTVQRVRRPADQAPNAPEVTPYERPSTFPNLDALPVPNVVPFETLPPSFGAFYRPRRLSQFLLNCVEVATRR